jgi:hypothetical protein
LIGDESNKELVTSAVPQPLAAALDPRIGHQQFNESKKQLLSLISESNRKRKLLNSGAIVKVITPETIRIIRDIFPIAPGQGG